MSIKQEWALEAFPDCSPLCRSLAERATCHDSGEWDLGVQSTRVLKPCHTAGNFEESIGPFSGLVTTPWRIGHISQMRKTENQPNRQRVLAEAQRKGGPVLRALEPPKDKTKGVDSPCPTPPLILSTSFLGLIFAVSFTLCCFSVSTLCAPLY